MTNKTRAWTLFAVMTAMYCFSQFFRMSTAVIAVDLAEEFELGPGRLSLLGGAFFYAFALVQIPLGMALDRWGAKRIIVAATVLAAAGSILFGLSPGWAGLLIGRILMGLGMSPVLMGSLKLIAGWFPAASFGRLSGLILGVGTLGSLLAATPLAVLVEYIGWRAGFLLFGGASLAASAAVAGLVSDPPLAKTEATSNAPLWVHLPRVLRLPSFWAMIPLSLIGYASAASLQGLWAGPYFMESLHYSRTETGNILLSLGLSGAAGSFFGGVLSDRLVPSRKWVIIGGCGGSALFLLPLTGVGAPSHPWLWCAVLSGFGFLGAFRTLVYAHIKESVPTGAVGTAVTAVNFFIMLGPALLQQVIGLVLTLRPGDYQTAFTVLLASLAAATLTYLGTRDTHPSREA